MSPDVKPAFGMFWLNDQSKPSLDYSQAEVLLAKEAHAHGCPNWHAVKAAYGAEWTLERYATCNEVMEKLILERALVLNPDLLQSLIAPTPRALDEPAGIHEVAAVPENYLAEMNLGSMAYGYSIPRVIIEIMGRDATGRLEIDYEKLPTLVDGIEQAIRESHQPFELLAKLSALALNLGVHAKKLLSHMFSQVIIDEQSCISQYVQLEVALQQCAPAVWETYDQMSDEEKRANSMWVRG
jgi:hypothetical protein